MSQDISQAAGAGIEIEVAGKTWVLSPLTVGDLAALQEDIRNRRLAAARKALGDLPREQLTDVLTDIVKSPIDGEMMDHEMETMAGCTFALWRSLRRKHPELTLEAVGDMFSIDGLFRAVVPMLHKLSGVGDDTGNPPKP